MKRTYEAWETEGGSALFEAARRAEHQAVSVNALPQFLFEVQADSWEKAMSIYHLRMGWETYKQHGPAQPCPGCAALYYPQGSGHCWHCGKAG